MEIVGQSLKTVGSIDGVFSLRAVITVAFGSASLQMTVYLPVNAVY